MAGEAGARQCRPADQAAGVHRPRRLLDTGANVTGVSVLIGSGSSHDPGIGPPGADRVDLLTGSRAVLALDANGLRVLARLGYGDPSRSYAASYRLAQEAAGARLPATVPAC
jgi:hypothetical protein